MKRFLMMAVLLIELVGTEVFAQTPNCTKIFQDKVTYAYGNYSAYSTSCTLMSGEGIKLTFGPQISILSNDRNVGGEYSILQQILFPVDASHAVVVGPSGVNNELPEWAQKWVLLHSNDFAKYIPNQLPNIVKQAIAKQKEMDAEIARATQTKVVADKLVQERRQAQDAAGIAKMNAGQLFAKADELSSSGDSVKAREVLRALVSRFPDHPLAAQAAAQMAGMSSNQTNAASNGANAGTNNGAVSNGSVPSVGGGKCWDVMAKREKDYEAINRRAVPAGATPPLMRVMWMTADSIKIIDTYCVGDAKAAKYRGELQLAYNQSKTACEQLSAGQCQPNPH